MSNDRTASTPSSAAPPATPRQLNLQAQTVGETGILTSLLPDVARARIEHLLGHHDAVSAILARVIADAHACVESTTIDDSTRACFDLLIASSNCLLGRSAAAMGNEAEGAPFFARAVSLFEARAPQVPEQPNANQLWTDYGIALYKTGSPGRAIEALTNAEKTGVLLAEMYHFLALAFRASAPPEGSQEVLEKAAEAARKGLQLAPADPGLCCTLAEVLFALHDTAGAVSAYLDGALGAARRNDVTCTGDLVTCALTLAPANRAAVTLAVEVYRSKQDFPSALNLVDAVLHDPPEQPWALALKGKLLRNSGKLDQAIDILRRVPFDPDTAWAATELAGALFDAGQFKAASEAVDKALEYNSRDAAAQLLKGRLLIEEGHPELAIAALENSLKLDPDSPPACFELGRAYFSCAQYPDAVRLFDMALAAAPDWGQAAGAKAKALYWQGQYGPALSQARRTLKMSPGDPEMLDLILDAARQLDREEDALREMEIELARDSRSPRAWYLKGCILLDRNDLHGAAESLARAADLDSGNADVQMAFSNSLRLLGSYEKAGEVCEKALQCRPVTAYALGWAGTYFGEVGDFARACQVLTQAATAFPKGSWLWGSLGWALQYRDDCSAAQSRECYEKAIAEDGETRNIWNLKGLADACVLCGLAAEANQAFQKLIEEFPDTSQPPILYVHGWSHYRLGNFAQAAELLRSAAATSPDFVFAQFDCALSLLADGRLDQARAAYAKALYQAASVHPRRQRGLLYVAAFDIAEAAKHGRIRSDAAEQLALLGRQAVKVGVDASTMPWLANPWANDPVKS
jgi:tetratricopeptide (TPR) repeat protein